MTICIAAVCNNYVGGVAGVKRMIYCTDWRVSSQLGSAETQHKQAWLAGNKFVCLTAGDPSEITVVVDFLRAKFEDAGTIDETNIADLVKQSVLARRVQRRNALAQSRFGMDHDETLRIGKDKLPQEHFMRYLDLAAAVKIDSEFIVAGFGESDDFIVETNRDCDVVMAGDFACIGEGEFLARASLIHREIKNITPFNLALYYVYEAKKAAERVNSVGKSTLITVLHEDGKQFRVKQDREGELERDGFRQSRLGIPLLGEI